MSKKKRASWTSAFFSENDNRRLKLIFEVRKHGVRLHEFCFILVVTKNERYLANTTRQDKVELNFCTFAWKVVIKATRDEQIISNDAIYHYLDRSGIQNPIREKNLKTSRTNVQNLLGANEDKKFSGIFATVFLTHHRPRRMPIKFHASIFFNARIHLFLFAHPSLADVRIVASTFSNNYNVFQTLFHRIFWDYESQVQCVFLVDILIHAKFHEVLKFATTFKDNELVVVAKLISIILISK